MANHNTPPPEPGPGPAPANVLAPPTYSEALPQIDSNPLSDEQLATSGHYLSSQITDLSNLQRRHNAFNAALPPTDPNAAARWHQDRAAVDTNIGLTRAEITRFVLTGYEPQGMYSGDGALLARQLGQHARAAREAENLRSGPQAEIGQSVTDADTKRATAHHAHNMAHLSSPTMPVEPGPGATPQQREQYQRDWAAHLARVKERQAPLRTLGYEAAVATSNRIKAGMRQQRFNEESRALEGFAGILEAVALDTIGEHDRRRQAIQDRVDRVASDLRTWGFQELPRRLGQERDIRMRLGTAVDALNNHRAYLGEHDSARAELIQQANRLRYRIEARNINFQDPLNRHPNDPAYTVDRGIRINAGQADEAVLYENGDVFVHGVRVNSAGREVPPPDPVDLSDAVIIPAGVPAETLVARWEESRLPEDAQMAHAALGEEITNMRGDENRLTGEAERLRTNILGARNRVTEIGTRVPNIDTRIADIDSNPSPTPEETTERTALINERNTILAEERRLSVLIPQMENNARAVILDRRRLRQRLNPAVYARLHIEAGANGPEPPEVSRARRIGSRILPGLVSAPEAPPSTALLCADGSITQNNVTINGRRGHWRIYADGRAVQTVYDNRARTWVDMQFRPDGTPI